MNIGVEPFVTRNSRGEDEIFELWMCFIKVRGNRRARVNFFTIVTSQRRRKG